MRRETNYQLQKTFMVSVSVKFPLDPIYVVFFQTDVILHQYFVQLNKNDKEGN